MTTPNSLDFLPKNIHYSIKVSARARNVRLKMSLETGLVIVIPRGFRRSQIPEVLVAHREWIERTVRRLDEYAAKLPAEERTAQPRRIALCAIAKEYSAEYRQTGGHSVTIRLRDNDRLEVTGAVDNVDLCKGVLGLWLKRMAKIHLVPWLNRYAAEKGFTIAQVIIRAQRTRWASCSQHGTISLNQRMLFLSPDLVEYLFLHELCHTVEMNHSPRFWALVASHDPAYAAKEQRIRAAWRTAPIWS